MFGEVLFCLVGKISLHFIKAQKKKKEKKDNQGNTDRRMDRHIDRHSLQDRTQSMAGYFEGNPLVIKTSIEFEETHTVTETECLKQEITMQSGYWTKNTKDMSATMKRQSSVFLTNESRFAFAKQHAVFCT